MQEFEPQKIRGAVLIVNEVFRAHSERYARELHGYRWQDYFNPEQSNGFIDFFGVLKDPESSMALVEEVNAVLDELTPLRRSILETRFGLDGEGPKTWRVTNEALNRTLIQQNGLILTGKKGLDQLREKYSDRLKTFIGHLR